jgi:TonB family protein
MPFFLDTRETSQRFGSHVAAFRSLLDADHIRHGSPDDLFGFAKVLEESNQFRLDLSTLVKSIVHQETDELLLTDMMSIIAASVGGPSFADTSADLTKPTNTLMEFLLGTGCWMKFGAPSPPRSQSTAPQRPAIHIEEPRPIRVSSSAPIVSENPQDRTGLLEAGELRQMLTRLEINTLQVKLHLDYIEQRISRIEPPPEVPAPSPQHLSQPDAVAGKIAVPPSERVPAFEPELPTRVEPELSTRGRAIFSPQLQPDPYSSDLSATDNDFSSPTFAYASEKGRSVVPLAIFLALLAAVAVFFLFAHTDKGQSLLQSGILRLKNVQALFSNAPATTLPPAPVQTASAPVIPVTPATKTPAPAPLQPPSSTSTTSPSLEPPTLPSPSRARYVQSNIMEGNLLSAPRPEYPSLARANRISGKVTLQVTISTSGSVETLRATNGPRPLREAAIEAVRKWRYKPYSVDGRPIEVATTVYVDFSPGSSLAASR